MKKYLQLITLNFCLAFLGLNAQIEIVPPAASCGNVVSEAIAPAVTTVVLNQMGANPTLTLNDDPGTGAPNYAYVITDPNNVVIDTTVTPNVLVGEAIVGTIEEVPVGSGSYVFDPVAMGLGAGQYSVTGFGFDLENINLILKGDPNNADHPEGIYQNSTLCELAVSCVTDGDPSNDFCLSCDDTPPPPSDFTTLEELFDFANGISSTDITIQATLDVIALIESAASAFGVPDPCYSINGFNEFSLTVEDMVGIEAKQLVESIQVYPNPSSDLIMFDLSSEVTGEVEYIIYDINGRQIDSGTNMAGLGINSVKIDISTYSLGNYYIQFSADGKTSTSRFIKD